MSRLGERPKRTWDEAALKWLAETQHKATHEEDKSKIRWLQQYLRGRFLGAIDRELIAGIGEATAQQSSPATANRILALIRAILRKAMYEWEWIEKAPRIKLYREARRRIRWITPEQAKRLLGELPEHQRDVVLFALATGLRQSNVIKLEWSQVDLERRVAWIHADQAKGRKDIHVSLSAAAVGALQRQVGKHRTQVFTFRGKPIKQANTKAWKGAPKRAEIEDFRWHDLRGTPGPAGWCKTAPRFTLCKRWGLGNPRAWCGGMCIWPRRTSQSMRKSFRTSFAAQIRHSVQKKKG